MSIKLGEYLLGIQNMVSVGISLSSNPQPNPVCLLVPSLTDGLQVYKSDGHFRFTSSPSGIQ